MGNDASGGRKQLEKKDNEVADPLYLSDVNWMCLPSLQHPFPSKIMVQIIKYSKYVKICFL